MEKKYFLEDFSLIVFLDGLPEALKDKVSAVQHKGTQLTVFLITPLSFEEESILATYVDSHDVNAPLSATAQYQKDLDRYMRRDSVRGEIMAEMAAENMERVRQGIWTVQDLIALTVDPTLKAILDDINTLSFELAYQKVDLINNPVVSDEVKLLWKQKLYKHFYL